MSYRKNDCFDDELLMLSVQLQFKTDFSLKGVGTV